MQLQPVKLDTNTVEGWFTITHKRNGKVLSQETIHNTSTKDGFEQIASLISGQATEASHDTFKFIAVDNSGATATADDSALASEITTAGLGRVAATTSKVTTTNPGDTSRLVHTFSATGTITARGAGIFDTSTASSGTLSARSTFAEKNLESGDTLVITYDLVVGS